MMDPEQHDSDEFPDSMDESEELRRLLDNCTKDGSTDRHGYPAVKAKTGGWKTGAFLLASEGLAALALTGVEVNMVLFSKSVLRQSNAEAANMFSKWMATLYLSPLLGAFLSDSYLGRYLTSVVFLAVMSVGLMILSLLTQAFMLDPEGCGKIGEQCKPQSQVEVAMFYLSIYLLALGSGSIEPAIATLGGDQFDEEDPEECRSKAKFLSYFYVAFNLGSLVAETLLVYIVHLGKWVLAFWISTACGFVALLSIITGAPRYRHVKPCSINPFSSFAQVFVASIRKIYLTVPSNGEGLYEARVRNEKDSTRRISHTDDFRFLDRAAVVTPSDMLILPDKSETPKKWRLCTVTQVEEVKCVLRLLPIWFCTILSSIVFVQLFSLFVEQGSAMNTSTMISGFHMPPASMTAFDILSSATFIFCYEKIIIPLYLKLNKSKPKLPSELQRIGIGLVILTVAMLTAGVVEQYRLSFANKEGEETSSLSIFWQIPQYVLVGVGEAFIYVAQWEFFSSQIPDSLKSMGLGLSMSSTALGSYFCSILLSVVMKITTRNGKPGWIPANLNDGHLDRFFFLSAALTALDLVIFVQCAKRFKSIALEKREVGQQIKATV